MLPPAERFAVWRESILSLFEALPDATISPECFRARVDGFNLQRTFFSQTSFSAQRYRSQPRSRTGDSPEPLLVQLYLNGGYAGHNGYREVQVTPGDISLLDLARPLATSARQSNTLSLVIPRDLMSEYARPGEISYGTVLRAGTPLAEILGHHLKTVWRNLPSASVADVESINHMLLGAVAGAFAGGKPGYERSVIALERATLERIRAYIDRNLSEPLDAGRLCRRFGCSRTQLYRLFQPLGGVSAYIRQARLNRCLEDLSRVDGNQKRIIDIAFRWGFSSHSHFCRLFRESFDMTPRDAVERGMMRWRLQQQPVANESHLTPAYHHWLRQL